MTTEHSPHDRDELERTRITVRRQLAEVSLPDEDERTVVVDRTTADEETVVVDRTPMDEDTIVVTRSESSEDTVVVESSGPVEDTVVVERSGPAGDTVVVERSGPTEDTVIVRGANDPQPPSPALTAPVPRARGDRRRGIAPPPVPAGFAPAATRAVGPGAVDAYTPRAQPRAMIAPVPPGGAAATRDPGRELPSMSRRSQRIARVAIASFAVACVVSVVGLIAIATLLW